MGQTFVEVVYDRTQGTPTTSRERTHSESSSHDKSPVDTAFDSSKQPRKGILKKKYVGADSGCVLEDINISEYFTSDKNDKLRRTKAYCAKTQTSSASRELENAEHSQKVVDIENRLGRVDLSKNDSIDNVSVRTMSTYISDDGGSPNRSKRSPKTSKSGSERGLSKSPDSPRRDNNHDISRERQTNSNVATSRSPATGVSKGAKNSSTPVNRKIKGILKRNGKFSSSSSSSDRDPSWRHSLGSQSSNSSGDLLDFSYDSADGDGTMSSNLPRPAWHTPAFNQLVPEDEGYTDVAELSVYHGDSGRGDSLCSQSNSDDIMNKINMLDETYFEEGIHRGAVSADLFNPNEAQVVYKQALAICNKIS